MMVLITYDVNVETPLGKARLRKVAKECLKYGQRVQNSVFECLLEPSLFLILKETLSKIIDFDKDSIRFYYLGDHWKNRVEHIGCKEGYDIEGVLMV
jgi:CRISPR-associated protein Cas2